MEAKIKELREEGAAHPKLRASLARWETPVNQPLPENISLVDFLQWEEAQSDRYEWIDGMVVRCAGGSDEHAAISSNLNAAFHAAVGSGPCFVRGSDRKLVPRDIRGRNLGSSYADLFVSCEPADRRGDAAHFPTIVVEVLSSHVGAEFTRKKDAYLGSARLTDYYVIDSTRRYIARYFMLPQALERGRLFSAEYRRGPLPVPTLGLALTFDQIYAGTSVPSIIYPVRLDDQEASAVDLD